jgi:hypothetical protein
LIDTKTKIDEEAEKFKTNNLLKDTGEYSKVLDELDLYKNKIDSFINYNIFHDTINENSSGDKDKSLTKTEFISIVEKYDRLTENLISQIKLNQNDVLNNNKTDFNVQYEIIANAEYIMENLTQKVDDLEEIISNFEKCIGNWNIVRITLIVSIAIMIILQSRLINCYTLSNLSPMKNMMLNIKHSLNAGKSLQIFRRREKRN